MKTKPLGEQPSSEGGTPPKRAPWKEPALHTLPQGRGAPPPPASQAHGDREHNTSLNRCKAGNARPSSPEHPAVSQATSGSPQYTQHRQKVGLVPKQGEFLGVPHPALGARKAGLPLESLPGGQRPTEHLTAVLHYVAMAVGILHAVLPSPGPLNLQQPGHKLTSAPPTPAPSPGSPAQPAGHVSKVDAATTHRGSDEKQRWLRGTERLYLRLRWLSDSVPPGRCGTQLTPPPTTG